MLEGLRGEERIAELCRREGRAQSLFCSWSKAFLEAGRRRLAGETTRLTGAWTFCSTMRASDVPGTLTRALAASGCSIARIGRKPRLLRDNGAFDISRDLAGRLGDRGMAHARGAPNHPQTDGKTKRWHQTPKSRILLANGGLPGALEQAIDASTAPCNHRRRRESIGNLMPADVDFGRDKITPSDRRKIREQTLKQRRLLNQRQAASRST